MSDKEIEEIIDKSAFMVAGYAFEHRKDGLVSIVNIEYPYHAAIIDMEGNVLETNMYDIELEIVLNQYWAKNKKYLSEEYA